MTVKTDGEAAAAAGEPDAFATAFDSFATPEGKKDDETPPAAEAAPAAEDKPAEGAEAKPEDKPEGEAPPAEAAPAAEDKPAEGAEGKPEDKPTEEAPKATTADDILAGLSKLINDKPAAPADDKGKPAPAAEVAPEIYSDEEKAFLAEYEKDWGDVTRGQALIRRAEYQQLVAHIFGEVVKFVQPIQQTAELLATRTHLADIETAVPDYSDQLREDVTKWVETQPAYLQAAYNQVINQGTVDEVKDLVDRFRAATGQQAPSGGQGGQPPQGKKDNELSEPAKKAAAALAPVASKRSGVQQPDDPSSFDDAWKAAAADL